MQISAGTDTFGRVKAVGRTPIVTKFAMLQFLPVYPIQSFYYSGPGRAEKSGVPFLAGSRKVAINGIPLARLDRASVTMAYVRGIFAVLVVAGIMAIIPLIMKMTGERLDGFALAATRGLMACFVVGCLGGLLTYMLPLPSQREREIRQYCGELLGICADPARVSADSAVAIEEYQAQLALPETDDKSSQSRQDCIRQLVSTRARIAQGHDVDQMEANTDRLLERLDHLSGAADQVNR